MDRETLRRFRSAPDLGLHFLLGFLLGIVLPRLVSPTVDEDSARSLAWLALAAVGVIYLWEALLLRRFWFPGSLAYIAVASIAFVAVWRADARVLLIVPCVGYVGVGSVFAWSLVRPPSIIERATFWMQPRAPEFVRPYCKVTTGLWAAALLLTGGLGVGLPFADSIATARAWIISAPLWLGALALAEFVFRKIWFRHYKQNPVDRVFARLFPAGNTARGRRSAEYIARVHSEQQR